jgi:hypothetical protein
MQVHRFAQNPQIFTVKPPLREPLRMEAKNCRASIT